ncbi:MAG TPA: DUF1292 domain-containing protein [Epulopiscium sp.]|nr:DUF1292 domain-containing protein [Candidatus Epulonipiscium sp.]
MANFIQFNDKESGEEIRFEVVDSFDIEGQRYILVADNDDQAAILKEVQIEEEEITYELIEDDDEFQKVALLFLESDSGYDLEF